MHWEGKASICWGKLKHVMKPDRSWHHQDSWLNIALSRYVNNHSLLFLLQLKWPKNKSLTLLLFIIFNYFQSFKGMPIPDEEFLAVSIDAKIDYHQTIDLGKANVSVRFISIYWLEIIIAVGMLVCYSVLCVVLFIMFSIP